MEFTKDEVREMCETIAPQYGLSSKLAYAVCLQEGAKNKSGNFEPDIARLEQGYYRKYVEPSNLATTSEILLSASYGIMQMMGLSLKEAGYFQWYFMKQSEEKRRMLGSAFSQLAIPSALDDYCINLEWMIKWGCTWLENKIKLAGGDIKKGLGLWNGDRTGKYASEVLARMV
jgi:hypothetical protein